MKSPRLLSSTHVRSVEALRVVVIRAVVVTTQVVGRLVSCAHLGLQGRGISINPLQLRKVTVENANDLAQL